MLRVPTALAALLFALALASPASADVSADDVIAQMTQLNKEFVVAYQAKKFDDARKILKQALDLAPTAALEAHPITARTHIHMGILLVGGLKQRDNGIKEFQQAIGIQGDIALTKALVTPELEDAFKEAKEAGGIKPPAPPPEPKLPPLPPSAPPPSAAPPTSPEPEAPATGISHEPVTQGNQGAAIPISATLQKDLVFDKLVLAYRPDGATDFLGREMKEQGNGRYGAEIPATATLGSVVSYYIEAEDADGNPVAARGSIDNPLVVHLSGVGAPKKERDEEDDDGGTEAPDYRYFFGLTAGTGFGWATGNGDTNADVKFDPAGMALARAAQVAPEFGYWLNETLMLSLQLRYQVVTGTTPIYAAGCGGDGVCHTANYAFAAFAKATWMYGEKQLHPFFSLAAGVGRIRHVVTFTKLTANCGPNHDQTCVDTIGAGPVLVGPGAGVMYDLTDSLGLLAQVNSVLGFPDFTANVDLNIGVAYQF
jgi:hypothetical protein